MLSARPRCLAFAALAVLTGCALVIITTNAAAAMQAGPDEVGLASGLLNTSQQLGHDVSERLRPASFSWVAVEADATPALRRRQVASVFTKRINRCGGHGPQSELNGST